MGAEKNTGIEYAKSLVDRLAAVHTLELEEYEQLISAQNSETAAYAAKKADFFRKQIYGTDVFIRGLIGVRSCCKNDCLYCGIRKSNVNAERYVLTEEQILDCCREGYALGFRTFVLQGGEGMLPVEKICRTVKKIRSCFPDCAITLSLGEYPRSDYLKMFESGADRYLLRHETADSVHYRKLHPLEMSFENRMRCLKDLKEIGFQVGCGFMVGSPMQTTAALAKDLKFIEEFSPDMCGIGPFIPHKDTPFAKFSAGSVEQTCFLLSLIRLIKPNILLPSTTALGTIDPSGREKGILAGANVVMPNLSPIAVRKKYSLYDNKICTGDESAQCLKCLNVRLNAIGFQTVTSRGDIKR